MGGGAIRAPWQARLRADVLGRPVLVSAEPDVSPRGAAMLALVGAGECPDLRAAHRALGPNVRRYEADPRRSARYDELFTAWRTVRAAIRSAGEPGR
jgi:gluconokinase/xylulokinase